jgi:hypothetical protein
MGAAKMSLNVRTLVQTTQEIAVMWSSARRQLAASARARRRSAVGEGDASTREQGTLGR